MRTHMISDEGGEEGREGDRERERGEGVRKE